MPTLDELETQSKILAGRIQSIKDTEQRIEKIRICLRTLNACTGLDVVARSDEGLIDNILANCPVGSGYVGAPVKEAVINVLKLYLEDAEHNLEELTK